MHRVGEDKIELCKNCNRGIIIDSDLNYDYEQDDDDEYIKEQQRQFRTKKFTHCAFLFMLSLIFMTIIHFGFSVMDYLDLHFDKYESESSYKVYFSCKVIFYFFIMYFMTYAIYKIALISNMKFKPKYLIKRKQRVNYYVA